MLYRGSITKGLVRASMLPTQGSQLSLSLRAWVFHPNTRRHVRLLGPCFKTGRLKPLCQHPEHERGLCPRLCGVLSSSIPTIVCEPSQHACVLIAYLSVDKIDRSAMGMSDQEHRIRVQRIFHEAMRAVLEPLIEAGKKGVEMISSDGSIRDVFPLLSCYAADYPEQCLVACTKYGTCVKCRAKATELGNHQPAEARTAHWTTSIINEASHNSGTFERSARRREFHTQCMSHDVAGTVHRPFWDGFPLCDIHQAIVPDVLHQLYQGVFKHLVTWCQKALGARRLDARIRTLPPSYGVRHFKNGISGLSQITGGERKNMAKILLGCLVGLMPKDGILAVAALLDFIYIAQYSA